MDLGTGKPLEILSQISYHGIDMQLVFTVMMEFRKWIASVCVIDVAGKTVGLIKTPRQTIFNITHTKDFEGRRTIAL
ncbi:hypothetical protein [uncultured Fretibacterium sp.]|uniref:hypothetical protein n=1 Tax=uncultured Fretibacterium sp. TaxID=1678694 RepID=UPI002625C370|nr:hypothetical protein [uncultured Fretibacterium sp.]